MKRAARGHRWLMHDLRRELAQRYASRRQKFYCLAALCVGAVFAGVVAILLIHAP